jgi:multidrug efflux system membrane fusion protein
MAKGDVKVNAVIDENHKQPGTVAFLENNVDPMTGTITAKARVQNGNEALWPGQFIKAEIVFGVEANALAVPAAAVQLGPQGPYVFVVKDGNVAELRQVNVSRSQGGETVLSSGVKAGEQVVVEGHLRLVNGAAVLPKPLAGEAPKPPAPPRG